MKRVAVDSLDDLPVYTCPPPRATVTPAQAQAALAAQLPAAVLAQCIAFT